MEKEEIEQITPASRKQWRSWLQKYHHKNQGVWITYYKMKSGIPSLSWREAVDEALCFGWIDSKAKSVDENTYIQFFCKRKVTSVWSKINKEKVSELIDQGLMAKAGLESIEKARENGSWAILDDVEELLIPKDLEKEFKSNPGSKTFFLSLSRSVRKSMLQWIVLAKRPETRQKRIHDIAAHAAKKQKPAQFR